MRAFICKLREPRHALADRERRYVERRCRILDVVIVDIHDGSVLTRTAIVDSDCAHSPSVCAIAGLGKRSTKFGKHGSDVPLIETVSTVFVRRIAARPVTCRFETVHCVFAQRPVLPVRRVPELDGIRRVEIAAADLARVAEPLGLDVYLLGTSRPDMMSEDVVGCDAQQEVRQQNSAFRI